jgi:hypothetical protein
MEQGIIAVYKCDACGMTIGTMTCGSCDKELDHGSITTDSGDEIQVSKCPDVLRRGYDPTRLEANPGCAPGDHIEQEYSAGIDLIASQH